MMKLKIYTRLILYLFTTISIFLLLSSCGEEQVEMKPIEVKVTNVVAKDVPITREWVGQTYGAVDIEIRARVDGWLQGLYFKEGTVVRQGALLYKIDDTELLEAVAEAEGKVASINTLLVQAEDDVKRYTPLAKAGAVSQRDLEIAVSRYEARKGELEAANAALKIAQTNLSYATVLSPITGLIGISQARVGDFVGRPPNPVILNTISRIDSIHVKFSISEQEYLYLVKKLGDNDKSKPSKKRELEMVLADGSVYPQKGYVVFAQRQIDATTGTLQFEASFPNKEEYLRPGQYAKIRTVIEERKNALVIPSRALIELQGQYTVYVVDKDNKVQLRMVTTATSYGQYTVIESGLSAGDKVIIEGMQKVKPELVVNPVETTLTEDSEIKPGEN
jgi:membrane fusion protein, multidrug efflux system